MAGHLKAPDPPGLIPPTPLDDEQSVYGFGVAAGPNGSHDLDTPYTAQSYSTPRLSFDSGPASPRMIDLPTLDETRLSPALSSFRFPSTQSRMTNGAPSSAGGSDTQNESISAISEDSTTVASPFNFTPQSYTAGALPRQPVSATSRDAGKRRKGHKYKHSSVSHQIFLEPQQRTPLSLPAYLPTPTRHEVQNSMTSEQKYRFAWCGCHFAVAAYVQWSAYGSLAMTALSRLLLFDAIGAVVCVMVDVMANFEVWKRSSLKHPFGLERIDVLAGFGLAVLVAFMGLDVLSHSIEHALESHGADVAHHARNAHLRVSPGSIDLSALLAISATLISALLLRNHVRLQKAMRLGRIGGWTSSLSNPSHLMTLSCSTLLLLLPLLSIDIYAWFDAALSLFVALAMVAFGVRLGTSLAPMLLMAYSADKTSTRASVRDVISEIQADPSISSVQEARFWQVHYGLCIASLRLTHKSSLYDEDAFRLREKLAGLVRNRLGSAYGAGGLKWEVSIQMSADND